jgi:hypothetical protein
MKNYALRDALFASTQGKVIAVESKREVRRQAIRTRIRTLKELVHDTFVTHAQGRRRFDVYQASKETCRQLGIKGGPAYEAAINAVKFAPTSRRSWREAIELLVPPELDGSEHNAADYESCDIYMR